MGSGPSAWFLMPLQGAVRTPQGQKQLINSCALDEQLWAGSGPHFSLVNGLLEVSLCFPMLMGEHVYGVSNAASPSCCPGWGRCSSSGFAVLMFSVCPMMWSLLIGRMWEGLRQRVWVRLTLMVLVIMGLPQGCACPARSSHSSLPGAGDGGGDSKHEN